MSDLFDRGFHDRDLGEEFAKDKPECPKCGGYVAVVLLRAWCSKTGGCGGHWTRPARAGGAWKLQRDASTG